MPIALALSLVTTAASGQYAINWYKVSGGGGTSTNSVYSLNGTIGQHDAGGPMTNGQYAIVGSFWALPQVVATPGAPTLSIAPASSGNATISWTPATPGYLLQESWSLSPANWTNSPSGAADPVTVSAAVPSKFYRLYKP